MNDEIGKVVARTSRGAPISIEASAKPRRADTTDDADDADTVARVFKRAEEKQRRQRSDEWHRKLTGQEPLPPPELRTLAWHMTQVDPDFDPNESTLDYKLRSIFGKPAPKSGVVFPDSFEQEEK